MFLYPKKWKQKFFPRKQQIKLHKIFTDHSKEEITVFDIKY